MDETIETRKRRDRKFGIIAGTLHVIPIGFLILFAIACFQDLGDVPSWLSAEAKELYMQEQFIKFAVLAFGFEFLFALGRIPPEIVHLSTADKAQKEDLGWLGKEKYSKYFINWFKTQVGQAKISLDMRNLLTAAYVLDNPNAEKKASKAKTLRIVAKGLEIFVSMILSLYLLISMDSFCGDSFYVKLFTTLFLFCLPGLICNIAATALENSIKKEVNQWSVQFQSAQNIKA